MNLFAWIASCGGAGARPGSGFRVYGARNLTVGAPLSPRRSLTASQVSTLLYFSGQRGFWIGVGESGKIENIEKKALVFVKYYGWGVHLVIISMHKIA